MTATAAVLSTATATRPASAASFTTLVGKSRPRRNVSNAESALLATVAHELRNPLASLRLSLDMLVTDFDELSPQSAATLLQRAQRSVAFLNGLVENLSSSAAVEAGRLDVRPTTVNLVECVEEAIGL